MPFDCIIYVATKTIIRTINYTFYLERQCIFKVGNNIPIMDLNLHLCKHHKWACHTGVPVCLRLYDSQYSFLVRELRNDVCSIFRTSVNNMILIGK